MKHPNNERYGLDQFDIMLNELGSSMLEHGFPLDNMRLLRECLYKDLISDFGDMRSMMQISEYLSGCKWPCNSFSTGQLICMYKELEFLLKSDSVADQFLHVGD